MEHRFHGSEALVAVEREIKLSVGDSFRMPSLTDPETGLREGPTIEHRLDATYFDAPDLRLGRAGITLRHREGEGGRHGRWTLKVPIDREPDDPRMSRHEVTKDAPRSKVPQELRNVISAVLRGAELVEVTRLRTTRRVLPLLLDDLQIAEVCDDAVTVMEGSRVRTRFREVEVELAGEAPPGLGASVLSATVSRLNAAGAAPPSPGTKLARAVGPLAYIPPDPLVPIVAADSRTDVAVQAALAVEVHRLGSLLPLVFIDPTVEVIHQARVATRRLRSHLRMFGPLLEPARTRSVRDELGWLAGLLGAIRDNDVLAARLTAFSDAFDDHDRPGLTGLIGRLGAEREPALAALRRGLAGKRAATLLEAVVAFAIQPPLTTAAERPAAETFVDLAAPVFDRLDRRARKLDDQSPVEALHELRILAKRARYAAEAALDAVPGARDQVRALARLQEVLGDLHDTSVVEQTLRAAMRPDDVAEAFVVGFIVATERTAARRLRSQWQKPWRQARRRQAGAWLHPSKHDG